MDIPRKALPLFRRLRTSLRVLEALVQSHYTRCVDWADNPDLYRQLIECGQSPEFVATVAKGKKIRDEVRSLTIELEHTGWKVPAHWNNLWKNLLGGCGLNETTLSVNVGERMELRPARVELRLFAGAAERVASFQAEIAPFLVGVDDPPQAIEFVPSEFDGGGILRTGKGEFGCPREVFQPLLLLYQRTGEEIGAPDLQQTVFKKHAAHAWALEFRREARRALKAVGFEHPQDVLFWRLDESGEEPIDCFVFSLPAD